MSSSQQSQSPFLPGIPWQIIEAIASLNAQEQNSTGLGLNTDPLTVPVRAEATTTPPQSHSILASSSGALLPPMLLTGEATAGASSSSLATMHSVAFDQRWSDTGSSFQRPFHALDGGSLFPASAVTPSLLLAVQSMAVADGTHMNNNNNNNSSMTQFMQDGHIDLAAQLWNVNNGGDDEGRTAAFVSDAAVNTSILMHLLATTSSLPTAPRIVNEDRTSLRNSMIQMHETYTNINELGLTGNEIQPVLPQHVQGSRGTMMLANRDTATTARGIFDATGSMDDSTLLRHRFGHDHRSSAPVQEVVVSFRSKRTLTRAGSHKKTYNGYKEGRNGKKCLVKPAKCLSAYNIFYSEERLRILAQLEQGQSTDCNYRQETSVDTDLAALQEHRRTGKRKRKPHHAIGFHELGMVVSARWRKLGADKRALCQAKADNDRLRFASEMEIYKRAQQADLARRQRELEDTVDDGAREMYLAAHKDVKDS